MRQRLLLIDVVIAAVAALLLIFLTAGLAIPGLVALLVLVVSALSFAAGRLWNWRRRREPRDLRSLRKHRQSMQRIRAPGPARRRDLPPPPPLRPTSRRGRRTPR